MTMTENEMTRARELATTPIDELLAQDGTVEELRDLLKLAVDTLETQAQSAPTRPITATVDLLERSPEGRHKMIIITPTAAKNYDDPDRVHKLFCIETHSRFKDTLRRVQNNPDAVRTVDVRVLREALERAVAVHTKQAANQISTARAEAMHSDICADLVRWVAKDDHIE